MKKRLVLFILTLTLVMPTCVFAQEEEPALPINTALSDALTITPYAAGSVYRAIEKRYSYNVYPPETIFYQEYYNGTWYSGTLTITSMRYSHTGEIWLCIYDGYIYSS